jgi:hypothetical protein
VTNLPLPSSVSDLWLQGTQDWNHQLLSTTFSPQTVNTITAIPVVASTNEDVLRWAPATNGKCTSKAIYSHLQQQQQHALPTSCSRSISPQADNILQKIWKGKTNPPLLKTFAWRLIHLALATAKRARRFTSHIDKHCTYCGAIENDAYLFFLCALPQQVWASSNTPVSPHLINPDLDGVQCQCIYVRVAHMACVQPIEAHV